MAFAEEGGGLGVQEEAVGVVAEDLELVSLFSRVRG